MKAGIEVTSASLSGFFPTQWKVPSRLMRRPIGHCVRLGVARATFQNAVILFVYLSPVDQETSQLRQAHVSGLHRPYNLLRIYSPFAYHFTSSDLKGVVLPHIVASSASRHKVSWNFVHMTFALKSGTMSRR